MDPVKFWDGPKKLAIDSKKFEHNFQKTISMSGKSPYGMLGKGRKLLDSETPAPHNSGRVSRSITSGGGSYFSSFYPPASEMVEYLRENDFEYAAPAKNSRGNVTNQFHAKRDKFCVKFTIGTKGSPMKCAKGITMVMNKDGEVEIGSENKRILICFLNENDNRDEFTMLRMIQEKYRQYIIRNIKEQIDGIEGGKLVAPIPVSRFICHETDDLEDLKTKLRKLENTDTLRKWVTKKHHPIKPLLRFPMPKKGEAPREIPSDPYIKIVMYMEETQMGPKKKSRGATIVKEVAPGGTAYRTIRDIDTLLGKGIEFTADCTLSALNDSPYGVGASINVKKLVIVGRTRDSGRAGGIDLGKELSDEEFERKYGNVQEESEAGGESVLPEDEETVI